MKLKKWIKISFGFTITLLCIWLAFRKIPFDEISRSIAGGNYHWLLPALFAQLLAILVRAQRWVVLLDQQNKFSASFWSQGIGYLFTNLFPFRLGEAARVLVMAEECKRPVVQVAGTAIIERVLDVGTMIVALVILLPVIPVPNAIIRSGQVLGSLLIGGIVAIFLFARLKEKSFRLIEWVCNKLQFLPKAMLIEKWGELVDGLTPLFDRAIAFKAVVLSLISWLLSGAVFYFAIQVFQPAGLVFEAIFMMVSLSFAVIIPSSPGFIGVFEFVGQQALVVPFGAKYSATDALGIALTAHLVYYFLSTLLGIVGLWRVGRSFASMMQLINRKKIPIE
jgi:glycosyltransferase 2 family protein